MKKEDKFTTRQDLLKITPTQDFKIKIFSTLSREEWVVWVVWEVWVEEWVDFKVYFKTYSDSKVNPKSRMGQRKLQFVWI